VEILGKKLRRAAFGLFRQKMKQLFFSYNFKKPHKIWGKPEIQIKKPRIQTKTKFFYNIFFYQNIKGTYLPPSLN
jgi:hypothetical protein